MKNHITPAELAEIEELLKGITPGNWSVRCAFIGAPYHVYSDKLGRVTPDLGGSIQAHRDAQFIASAPARISKLVQAVRELQKELDGIKSELREFADKSYVDGCRLAEKPECKGWERKAATGKFGTAEFEAHCTANQKFGAHFGIYEFLRQYQLKHPIKPLAPNGKE